MATRIILLLALAAVAIVCLSAIVSGNLSWFQVLVVPHLAKAAVRLMVQVERK